MPMADAINSPIELTYEGAVYAVQAAETALDALLRGGANVPFSCRKGSCHTCLMRAIDGAPPLASQRGLSPELVDTGHFLPCLAVPTEALTLGAADRSVLFVPARVAEKQRVSPRVVRLLLEPEVSLGWVAGQYVNLRANNGLVRSYSIASIAREDYFLELHVGLVRGGALSGWVHQELRVGDTVELQGPFGACVYREEFTTRRLLMLATGTGIAPILGIVRDALARRHEAPIEVVHAVAAPEEAYAHALLEALANTHTNVHFTQLLEHDDPVAACFDPRPDLRGAVLYLCGNPEMVYGARVRAIASGVHRREILADPFFDSTQYWPKDREKLESWPKQPELWEALERGPKLRRILTDFYDRVYEDPRLSPYFHNVTKDRAIAKQYEFLADVFTGEIPFFGLKPFNAHHWMIISDDLFDYREELFESVLQSHGVPEELMRQWLAFHELFRRELVKNTQRGLIVDGKEHLREGFSQEQLTLDMVCDGCGHEMLTGSTGRMHLRTGQLYCQGCGAKRLSGLPAALDLAE